MTIISDSDTTNTLDSASFANILMASVFPVSGGMSNRHPMSFGDATMERSQVKKWQGNNQ